MMHSRPDDLRAIVPNRASGYAKTDGGALRNASFMDPRDKTPGGGWLSTAGDMVRFGLALQSGRLLVWHGGVQQGVTTNLYMLPHDHSVVAIMTNLEGEGLTLTQLASDVMAIARGR
jgi:hypothetical protein